MVAQAPFAKSSVNLLIVDDRKIGDPVFLRKLKRIVVGDLRGTVGLFWIDFRTKPHYFLRKFGDIALLDGRLVRTATYGQGRQQKR